MNEVQVAQLLCVSGRACCKARSLAFPASCLSSLGTVHRRDKCGLASSHFGLAPPYTGQGFLACLWVVGPRLDSLSCHDEKSSKLREPLSLMVSSRAYAHGHVQWSQVGLVFKAHGLCVSLNSRGLRVIKKKHAAIALAFSVLFCGLSRLSRFPATAGTRLWSCNVSGVYARPRPVSFLAVSTLPSCGSQRVLYM